MQACGAAIGFYQHNRWQDEALGPDLAEEAVNAIPISQHQASK